MKVKIFWFYLKADPNPKSDEFLGVKLCEGKTVEILTIFCQCDEIYHECDEIWTYPKSCTNFLDKD